MAHELVLPIMIVSLEGGKEEQTLRVNPSDLRHWQIEEFLRQTGKADNTQRTHLYLNRAKFDDRSLSTAQLMPDSEYPLVLLHPCLSRLNF